jgi:excisionase family DNA binding protein
VIRLIDKHAVAAALSVSVRSVDRLRASGELASVRVRGRVRFRPDDVEAFVDAQRRSRALPREEGATHG